MSSRSRASSLPACPLPAPQPPATWVVTNLDFPHVWSLAFALQFSCLKASRLPNFCCNSGPQLCPLRLNRPGSPATAPSGGRGAALGRTSQPHAPCPEPLAHPLAGSKPGSRGCRCRSSTWLIYSREDFFFFTIYCSCFFTRLLKEADL